MEDRKHIGMSITSDPDETRFEPAIKGEAEREVLDKMRLLVVADLNPAAPEPDWTAGDATRLLTSPNLDPWLAELRPSVEVSVPNYLGGDGSRLSIDLVFDAMDAFKPAGLAKRIPIIHSAGQMKEALKDARDGRIGRDELQTRLQAAGMRDDTAAQLVAALAPRQPGSRRDPAGADDGALSRILGLVSLDAHTDEPATNRGKNPAESALDALVGAVASEASADVDREEADRALLDLERRLTAQISAIVTHPDFRSLEAAWRGLKFLADRADFRDGMRLQVLAASREQLHAAMHHQVLMPEYEDGATRDPLAAVVLNHTFGSSLADVAALGDLAATGASMQIPIIASVDAQFFGFDQPTDLSRLGVLRQHLATDAYISFRKLRERPDAQFLSLALPSFLLREPHTPVEQKEDGYLWGGGALLAAAALLASHREGGWPTHLGDRRVEDLVVRKTRMGALSLAASFADRVATDLGQSGFFAFRAPLNRAHASAGYPATLKASGGTDPAGGGQSNLSGSVFSALAAHRILRIQEELAGLDADEAARELEDRMRSFLGGGDLPEDAVTIQELDEHENEDSRTYGVRLRPPRKVLPHGVGLVLGATIAKASA